MSEAIAITPKEAREIWVERLRNGTIPQIQGQLAKGVGRCCLGVACDIAVELGVIDGYPSGRGSLSDPVRDLMGLRHRFGQYGYDRGLALENDSGSSFAKIADIIESEPEGLFAVWHGADAPLVYSVVQDERGAG